MGVLLLATIRPPYAWKRTARRFLAICVAANPASIFSRGAVASILSAMLIVFAVLS